MTDALDSHESLEVLTLTAAKVAAEAAEAEAAIAARDAAEAMLLRAAVAAVKPALNAIATKALRSSRTTWHGNNTYTETVTERAVIRTVVLFGDDTPTKEHPRDNEGGYEGSNLSIDKDGNFLEVSFSGAWSRWVGTSSEWHTVSVPRTVEEVVAEYDVGDIVEALAKRLQCAVGSRAKLTARANERAAKLTALAALMGGTP